LWFEEEREKQRGRERGPQEREKWLILPHNKLILIWLLVLSFKYFIKFFDFPEGGSCPPSISASTAEQMWKYMITE
jgi:hypothetical protein